MNQSASLDSSTQNNLSIQDKFSDFSTLCRSRVEKSLSNIFLNRNDNTRLHQAMQYSLLNGGKRVRPILVYASAYAISAQQYQTQLYDLDLIASAIESLHVYSLIHDDLPAIDDDDLRRGKPTCHKAFDEATAILAGDALQTLAFELLTQTKLNAEQKIQLVTQLAQASGAQGMVLGQAIDLAAVDQQLSLAQLETMHRHKTGALIRASICMGATSVNATQEQVNALDQYASAIGLAFQVQDDILDVVADTATLGKQQGADIAKHKPTYVALLGLDGAREKLQQLYALSLESLSAFGAEAYYLRELARYIVERDH